MTTSRLAGRQEAVKSQLRNEDGRWISETQLVEVWNERAQENAAAQERRTRLAELTGMPDDMWA